MNDHVTHALSNFVKLSVEILLVFFLLSKKLTNIKVLNFLKITLKKCANDAAIIHSYFHQNACKKQFFIHNRHLHSIHGAIEELLMECVSGKLS